MLVYVQLKVEATLIMRSDVIGCMGKIFGECQTA